MSTKSRKGKRRNGSPTKVSVAKASRAIATTLSRCSVDPISATNHRKLIQSGYAALLGLERGHMDEDSYFLMNVMNTILYCLSTLVYHQGTERVKEAMVANLMLTERASDALVGIAERYSRLGRFGSTGEQLKVVKDVIVNLDDLSQTAPSGLVIQALQDAQQMVEAFMKKPAA